jgi:hypothetical protein
MLNHIIPLFQNLGQAPSFGLGNRPAFDKLNLIPYFGYTLGIVHRIFSAYLVGFIILGRLLIVFSINQKLLA